MADKSISELISATQITESDLFLLEQGGTAKKLLGQVFVNWLTHYADGHGGVQTIAKTGTSGLTDTYTITFADTSTSTFTVTNGKGISGITQYWAVSASNTTVPSSWQTTRPTMTTTNKYLWSYMRYAYNDDTHTDTTKAVVGVYGDTGAQTYVWIKYAAVNPTSDADLGDNPDEWIGIYHGLASTAPTSYSAYTWYRQKGEQGITGDPATLDTASVSYQISQSGAVVPDGSWSTIIPTPVQGAYLWTRIVLEFNTGSPITFYAVSRYGIDGTGSVVSVNGVSPDGTGNVVLTASDIVMSDNRSVQEHVDELEGAKLIIKTLSISAATSSQQIGSATDARINANTQLIRAEIANPAYQTSDWTVTTYDAAPQVRVTGTCSAATTVKLILAEVS